MRRALRLWWAWLLLGLLPRLAYCDDAAVWIALTERGGIYAETAATLGNELVREGQRAAVLAAPWQELQPAGARPPQVIVTLGASAFKGMVERLKREPVLAAVPVLAVLLPQASYEALAPRPPFVTSAVFLDQPVERYLELVRLAMPERRKIGILFGPDSAILKPAISRAASSRGLALSQPQMLAEREDIYPALRTALADADVLLMVPDSHVFNANSLQNVLITSYRQRVPMVTFSESYVKAGAVLALYTSPAQAATQAAAVVRGVLAGRGLPPPHLASGFSIATNPEVARSLGMMIDDPERLAQALRRKEEGR